MGFCLSVTSLRLQRTGPSGLDKNNIPDAQACFTLDKFQTLFRAILMPRSCLNSLSIFWYLISWFLDSWEVSPALCLGLGAFSNWEVLFETFASPFLFASPPASVAPPTDMRWYETKWWISSNWIVFTKDLIQHKPNNTLKCGSVRLYVSHWTFIPQNGKLEVITDTHSSFIN